MILKRVLRVGAWSIGSVLGLALMAYAAAVAINWRDRPPSEAAIRLTKVSRDRPTIVDEDNAFVYLTGFSAAPGDDPRIMGARRIARMQAAAAAAAPNADGEPISDEQALREGRHSTIKQFIEACNPPGSGCDDAFLASSDVFERWVLSEPWLLKRYQTLIAHPAWQETVQFDLRLPLPSYSLVMDGQRLLLMQAHALAVDGNHAAVRKLLDDDARFWREVLESSDILITKMVAVAALRRHFRWGNLVLREFAHSDALLAIPAQWDLALTDAERSMRRCLAAEWLFSSEQFRLGRAEYWDDAESEWWQKLLNRAAAPLYQQQDTINKTALIYEAQAPLLDVPLANYESAMRHASETIDRLHAGVAPFNSPYNFVGKFGVFMGMFDFTSYSRRINDVEGMRRAAVTTVRLRAQRVSKDEVAAALSTAPLRNPYDNRPFEWDAEQEAIVFVGLERAERGTHPYRY